MGSWYQRFSSQVAGCFGVKNVKVTEFAEEKSFAPRVGLLPPLCVVVEERMG